MQTHRSVPFKQITPKSSFSLAGAVPTLPFCVTLALLALGTADNNLGTLSCSDNSLKTWVYPELAVPEGGRGEIQSDTCFCLLCAKGERQRETG